MFWDKFTALCEQSKKSVNKVSKELSISAGSLQTYREGKLPNAQLVLDICRYFDVSADYLLTDSEANIITADKKDPEKCPGGSAFHSVESLAQRWESLRHGEPLTDKELISISDFVNCKIAFLCSDKETEFEPKSERLEITFSSFGILDMILGVMDRCPDSDDLRVLQIQLSHIVRYWLSKKGFGYEQLSSGELHSVSIEKLNFLYGVKEADAAFRYGFNFTELDEIREIVGTSFLYLFTGVEIGELGESVGNEK